MSRDVNSEKPPSVPDLGAGKMQGGKPPSHPASSTASGPTREFLHELGNVFSSILAIGATIRAESSTPLAGSHHIDSICDTARRGLRAMDRFSASLDPRQQPSNGSPLLGFQTSTGLDAGAALPTGSGTILVVENEQIVRDAAVALLSRLGYETLSAADTQMAVDIFRTNQARVDLVLLDMKTPGGKDRGCEVGCDVGCFGQLREIDSEVRVLLVTGDPREQQAEELLLKGALGIVGKPFELGVLAYAVKQALTAHLDTD